MTDRYRISCHDDFRICSSVHESFDAATGGDSGDEAESSSFRGAIHRGGVCGAVGWADGEIGRHED